MKYIQQPQLLGPIQRYDRYNSYSGKKQILLRNKCHRISKQKNKRAKSKINRHVVIMNRNGRYFEKEYPEYEGERENVKQNGKNYEVFIPYTPFGILRHSKPKKEGIGM